MLVGSKKISRIRSVFEIKALAHILHTVFTRTRIKIITTISISSLCLQSFAQLENDQKNNNFVETVLLPAGIDVVNARRKVILGQIVALFKEGSLVLYPKGAYPRYLLLSSSISEIF